MASDPHPSRAAGDPPSMVGRGDGVFGAVDPPGRGRVTGCCTRSHCLPFAGLGRGVGLALIPGTDLPRFDLPRTGIARFDIAEVGSTDHDRPHRCSVAEKRRWPLGLHHRPPARVAGGGVPPRRRRHRDGHRPRIGGQVTAGGRGKSDPRNSGRHRSGDRHRPGDRQPRHVSVEGIDATGQLVTSGDDLAFAGDGSTVAFSPSGMIDARTSLLDLHRASLTPSRVRPAARGHPGRRGDRAGGDIGELGAPRHPAREHHHFRTIDYTDSNWESTPPAP